MYGVSLFVTIATILYIVGISVIGRKFRIVGLSFPLGDVCRDSMLPLFRYRMDYLTVL